MPRLPNVLPILLPLVLLTVSGCPKKAATDPSLPKAVQGKPGGPGQTPLILPAGVTAVPGIADAEQLAVGDEHACVIRAGGRVFCWGDNAAGALGLPGKKVYQTPVEIPEAADAVEIAAGRSTTCVRKRSGVVYCWSGALTENLDDPLELKATEMPTLKGALTIDVGFLHVCGAFQNGTVRCAKVPLHRPYQSIYHMPGVFNELSGVDRLLVGFHAVCVRMADSRVRCMGEDFTDRKIGGVPEEPHVSVPGPSAPSETVFEHAHERCPNEHVPGCTAALDGVRDLAMGDNATCAALADGDVACWGSFEQGAEQAIHMGRHGFSRVPIRLGFTGATAVAPGDWHVCALVADGAVACLGDNSEGQLGDDTKTASKTPRLVPQLTGLTQLGSGDTFNCALHGSGQVVCWGSWRVKVED